LFNGKIRLHPERLSVPRERWKPTVYAIWNDLLHEDVPVNFLEDALAVITQCPQHTFLMVTKRARRLNLLTHDRLRVSRTDTWPIKNLWLVLTICNQQEADENIPHILQVPGKKVLNIEPMLSEIDVSPYLTECTVDDDEGMCPYPCDPCDEEHPCSHRKLDVNAVILGGETGPGARPMHPDWVRSVRDQCAAAGIPFFLKQWGEWQHESQFGQHIPSLRLLTTKTKHHQFGDGSWSYYMVKKERAARLLDGRTHDELPWRRPPCLP